MIATESGRERRSERKREKESNMTGKREGKDMDETKISSSLN